MKHFFVIVAFLPSLLLPLEQLYIFDLNPNIFSWFNHLTHLSVIQLFSNFFLWKMTWTFFKTNPWFIACFKFLMWIIYSVLSCKLATSFLAFLIFILSGTNGYLLRNSCNFSGYWISTSKKYSPSLSSLCFCHEIFIKLKTIFDPLKTIYRKLLRNCLTI